MYAAARITTGSDFYDDENLIPSSEIAFLSDEDEWDDTVVPRLMAAGADLSKVHQIKMVSVTQGPAQNKQERALQLDTDVKALEEFLEQHPNVRAVVVDPVSNYMGNVRMMEDSQVRKVLNPLRVLSEKFHIAVMVVMHLNKKVDLNSIYRIGGTMGYLGIARLAWLFIEAPKEEDRPESQDEYLMLRLKANIIKKNVKGLRYVARDKYVPVEGVKECMPCLEFIGKVDSLADEVVRANSGVEPKRAAHRPAEQTPAAVDWLKEFLSKGPQSKQAVMYYAGEQIPSFTKRTIERAALAPS